MIIGNRTDTPRAIPFAGKFLTIPPMGMITIDDTAANKEEMEKLKATSMWQILLDNNILTYNEKVKENALPVKVQGPMPPAELTAQPEHPRVKRQKARKTDETMRV